MKKLIFASKCVLTGVVLVLLSLLVFGFFAVPNEIQVVSDRGVKENPLYSLKPMTVSLAGAAETKSRKYNVQVNLFHAIPVKTATMTVRQREYATLSGDIFGLRLYTDGIVIVDTQAVLTEAGEAYPAQDAGLQKGDVILEINGVPVTSHTELATQFAAFSGTPFTLLFERDGERQTTTFSPAYCAAQQRYLAGLWIKDSAAGIGTMTFFDRDSGVYAGLGHAVCDPETGEVLPLFEGDVVSATVSGCYKSSSGTAGELCGYFSAQRLGSLLVNGEDGVYGVLDGDVPDGTLLPVATKKEVKPGKAQIVATVDERGPQVFEARIEKVDVSGGVQNMTIRITDGALLEKTGGIVQGMSGSPVLQDGMLVGAVTHVFVNDPERGYAIFAQTMLEKAKKVEAYLISNKK